MGIVPADLLLSFHTSVDLVLSTAQHYQMQCASHVVSMLSLTQALPNLTDSVVDVIKPYSIQPGHPAVT